MQISTALSIDTLEQGFNLDDWHVSPHSNSLHSNSTLDTKHLESKAMQVLLQLAGHAGDFVSRDKLLASVWNTRFVTEDVLTGAIAAIRKALGDDPKQPHFIETRRGVGYRLIVKAVPMQAGQKASSKPRPVWSFAGLALLTVIILVFTFPDKVETPLENKVLPEIPTLAVLPFADYSQNKGNGYFSDAVTEALIQKLAELQQFRVISRTSIMPYRDTEKSARQIAEELGVDWFVEGSVLHHDDQVRITAQLIDASQDEHLWAGHFDRSFTDIFALINDVVTAISLPVINSAVIAQPNQTAIAHNYELPPEQLDRYLMARYLLSKQAAVPARQALAQFTLLSEQTPDFFGGYLGQAQALLLLFKQSQLDHSALDTALQAIQRSLEINPQASEAYRCRGQILFFRDLDYLQAESDYLTGITLNASDHIARRRYAWLLVAQQRYPEARQQLTEIKRLDPIYYADAANALLMLYAGDASAAIADLERLKISSPDSVDIHSVLWRAYLADGQVQQGTSQMLEWLRLRGLQVEQHTALQQLLNQQAYTHFYQAVLDQDLVSSPLHQAMLQLRLEQIDIALDLIEQAWQTRNPSLAYLPVMPNFQRLHNQLRFKSLLSQLPPPNKLQSLSSNL